MAMRMLPAVVGPARRCEMLRPRGWRGAFRAGPAARLALAGSRGAGLGKIAHRRGRGAKSETEVPGMLSLMRARIASGVEVVMAARMVAWSSSLL
jgi:hypothetical protein